jgi:hypothetical protein
MMKDDDEDDNKPAADENAGPKIKMGRIGKKKKGKTGGASETAGKTSGVGGGATDPSFARSAAVDDDRGNENFTEQDIEFMRHSI